MNPLDGQDRGTEPGVCLSWNKAGLSHMTTWHPHPLVKQRRWASHNERTMLKFGLFNFVLKLEMYFDRQKSFW